MIELRPIFELRPEALAPLLEASEAEGFRFVARLAADWASEATRFTGPGEVLLGGYVTGQLVAVGGLTTDSYASEPGVGRLRRVYVLPAVRRQGIGERLVRALEAAATGSYGRLVLRTDTVAAARFYESLGYTALAPGASSTHGRRLASSEGTVVRAI